MPERIRVYEHETLRVGDRGFTARHFDGLVRYNQQHGDSFFTVGYRSLRFQQYVGVLQVGGLTIEILPKADRFRAADREQARTVLIDMLRYCGYLRLCASSEAHLRVYRASLFDLYLETYLHEVEELVHQGLVKRYARQQDNLEVLKGRILFNRHLTQNLIHRERFYVEYERYCRDNHFNRILKCATAIVARSARSPRLQGEAKRLTLRLEDVADVPVTDKLFARLRYDRNTERYRKAMTLARLIILNRQPDISAGNTEVMAILFDMNALFEEYIYRQLRRAAQQQTGITVSSQPSYHFWQTGGMQRKLRPDIIVAFNQERQKIALDTKWKVPAGDYPDDGDLRQIFAYTVRTGARYGYLLYPRVDGRRDINGRYILSEDDSLSEKHCGMWFVELLSGARLNRKLGADMIKAMQAVLWKR